MQIQIRRSTPELSSELVRQVERKLHFSLGRFGGDVRTVLVELSRTEGLGAAGGGCVITIRTGWGSQIRIEESGADFQAATGRAADRAGRALERQTRLRDEHGL